jgi:hypothetical protein
LRPDFTAPGLAGALGRASYRVAGAIGLRTQWSGVRISPGAPFSRFPIKDIRFSCDQMSVDCRRANLLMCPRGAPSTCFSRQNCPGGPEVPSRLAGQSLPDRPSLSLAVPGDSLAFPVPLVQSVHYEEGSTDRRARSGDDTADDRSCRLDCYGARDVEGLSRAAGTAPTTRTAGRRPGTTPSVQELDVPW